MIQAFNDDMPYDQFVKAQLAGDLMDEKVRYKMLPATGFLGLGPWYYDNGAVEVTRADERHDRVDVVTRGFLGPDGGLRALPRSQVRSDSADRLLLAGGRVPEHDLPRVSAGRRRLRWMNTPSSGARWTKKQKMLQEMQTDLSSHLSESLVFKTANYLEGVYEVAGQKKEAETVVEARKLDYELLDAVDQVHGEAHR